VDSKVEVIEKDPTVRITLTMKQSEAGELANELDYHVLFSNTQCPDTFQELWDALDEARDA
jgi:hypothetical protein